MKANTKIHTHGKSGYVCVTSKNLRKIWKNENTVSDKQLQIVASEINHSRTVAKIDTELRICHFLAQVFKETGPNLEFEENLNYSPSMLTRTFLVYRQNPDLASQHGYDRVAVKPAKKVEIASHAYAHRNGNGNAESGDGWKFRGRGMIQLTGRSNYSAFQSLHYKLWGEPINFIANPDLLTHPTYAVRSALAYWYQHKLYQIADTGSSKVVCDRITAIINRNTDSYGDRYDGFCRLYQSGVFKHVG